MRKRVYYHDTDAGGVVYYGRYLNFLEEARTELLETTGLAIAQLAEDGFMFAVRRLEIDYLKPARYGDDLEVVAEITGFTQVQINFRQSITINSDKNNSIAAIVQLVCIGANFKPTRMPSALYSVLPGLVSPLKK